MARQLDGWYINQQTFGDQWELPSTVGDFRELASKNRDFVRFQLQKDVEKMVSFGK